MKIKILVVDDTKGWLDFHRSALFQIFGNNAEITLASSARAGYDLLLGSVQEPYDLVISDLQMESDFAPLLAGEWFVGQLQNFKEYFKTKVIIISAMYNINMTAARLGVEYLSKTSLSSGILPMKLKLESMGFNV